MRVLLRLLPRKTTRLLKGYIEGYIFIRGDTIYIY
jgi:hypothetical protein